ncbi:MAG: hypothetical protein ACKPDI_12880 [Actinomycetota bacterium]
MSARGRGNPQLIFLHGYTTAWPKAPVWNRLLGEVGLAHVGVTVPVAPKGSGRRDPFNPRGLPSWFRYGTDHGSLLPQEFDAPHAADLVDAVADTGALWRLMRQAVRAAGGAHRVALAGESQGGVVAAVLAMRWNAAHPDDQLGAVGLLRTAADPSTWVAGVPPRMRTRFHVVLGAADTTFRPTFSLHSLEPLLRANPATVDEVPSAYRHASGNVHVEVLPDVGHGDSNRRVYRRYVQLLSADWPSADG